MVSVLTIMKGDWTRQDNIICDRALWPKGLRTIGDNEASRIYCFGV